LNYLGHSTLSNHFGKVLIGNLIGDFVKGKLEPQHLDEEIRAGLELHRKIDEFTDQHPSCLRAKNIFRVDYKLYSGPIIDVVWDYYLANDPSFYKNSEALRVFSQKVYASIQSHQEWLPEPSHLMFEHLINEDWLYDVRHLKGLKIALHRLMYRFKNDMTEDKAFELVMRHYYELNQMYLEFIDDIRNTIKLY